MKKKAITQMPRVLYVICLVILSFIMISPFIVPVVLAGTVALALFPLQARLVARNWPKKHAAALITLLFTFVISIPFLFFVTKGTLVVIDQLEHFSVGEKIQSQGVQSVLLTIKSEIIHAVQKVTDKIPLSNFLTESRLDQYFKSVNIFLLGFFQNFATSLPMVILFLIVMIFCTFSFLKNAASVRHFFQILFGFNNPRMEELVHIFIRNSRQVYLSNIITGAIQSSIVATGAYFVTGVDWFLTFFVTLIFSFVPVIGASPMAFLFAVVAFFQGNKSGAIILIVVGSFTGVIDNILRPWLASSGESKTPPIVSFVFVIGGALLLGFPGLFIGLLIGSIAYDTLPIFWQEIAVDGKKSFVDLVNFEEEITKTEIEKH